MYRNIGLWLFIIWLCGCNKSSTDAGNVIIPPPNPVPATYYFPPLTGSTWDTASTIPSNWNSAALQQAFDYAGSKNSFGVLLLHNGRIVKEQYWNSWTKDTRYYIASAGKSVVGFLAGIAQQDGILSIDQKTADFLGAGWTSLPTALEDQITVRHQLTMTSGLEDNVPDSDCTIPSCLTYKAVPGTRWAYHNAPYLLVQKVLANASGLPFGQYAKQKLFDRIGMPNSFWLNNTMWCTTREAARFGSLILRKGNWDGIPLLNDTAYFANMTTNTQTVNNAYGYLWWLNGKPSFMVPTLQTVFPGSLVPNAPADMIMALGKDDKKIYVVPSLNIVLIRLGDSAGSVALGPSGFDNEFWGKLKPALGY